MNARHVMIGLTAVFLFIFFRFLFPLIAPFVLAVIFGKMVSPIIRFFHEKLRWNYKISVIVTVFVVLSVLLLVLFYVGGLILKQGILFIQHLPATLGNLNQSLCQVCCYCDELLDLGEGTSYGFLETQKENLFRGMGTKVLPAMSAYATGMLSWLGAFSSKVFVFFLATILILLDKKEHPWREKIRPFTNKLKGAGLAYLKAQGIIVFLIAVVISVGLLIIGNSYGILLGMGIAVFDAFPVVGSGIVLIPWTLWEALHGNFFHAAILATLFVVASFLREVLEPRLFGKELGMKSLFVLIAVYAGVQLFGVGGILIGPICLIVLKSVYELLADPAAHT